ncbi:MAG: arsenate reductase ArsC [Planctomycetaceae bacterium]|nr:arsenate reductase ArsC [Planctomycetaceae bacterium]
MTVKRLLFVCVENSNRSQMAEAFARMFGGDDIEAYSAGSNPSGQVNPKAIAAMAEVGYDLTGHHSKSLDDLPEGEYAAAITMGCGDSCPNVSAPLKEDWELPDPRHLPPEEFHQVREAISAKVKDLLTRI